MFKKNQAVVLKRSTIFLMTFSMVCTAVNSVLASPTHKSVNKSHSVNKPVAVHKKKQPINHNIHREYTSEPHQTKKLPAQTKTNLPASSRMRNYFQYPAGSIIYPDGRIVMSPSQVLFPSNTVLNDDGSKTFYYPNGTFIKVQNNQINSNGTYLRPGINGGL